MTNKSYVSQAKKKAHEACPCTTQNFACSCLVCKCKTRVWSATGAATPPPPDERAECGWPGHAAIDAIPDEARTYGPNRRALADIEDKLDRLRKLSVNRPLAPSDFNALDEAIHRPDAIGQPEAGKDEVEKASGECYMSLHEAIAEQNPKATKWAEQAISELASLARRGRGHARNCRCCDKMRPKGEAAIFHPYNCPVCKEEWDVHPYTDHRCQPLSETARQGLLALVNQQAEDEGLWFRAQTAPEGYLQQELRKLHAAVESALAEGGGER